MRLEIECSGMGDSAREVVHITVKPSRTPVSVSHLAESVICSKRQKKNTNQTVQLLSCPETTKTTAAAAVTRWSHDDKKNTAVAAVGRRRRRTRRHIHSNAPTYHFTDTRTQTSLTRTAAIQHIFFFVNASVWSALIEKSTASTQRKRSARLRVSSTCIHKCME